MIPTISLLGLSSRHALYRIINHYNSDHFNGHEADDDTVVIGTPVVVSNKITRVSVTAKERTPYKEARMVNGFNLTYNRLNLVEVFNTFTFSGIALEAPVTTEKVLSYLKQHLSFVHDETDFVDRTVTSNGTFLLEAKPGSLRWQGSLSIPLTVQSDLSTLIHNEFLDGLDYADTDTPVTAIITKTLLRGLQYIKMDTPLEAILTSKLLRGLNNRFFTTPISKAFTTNRVNWTLAEINGAPTLGYDMTAAPTALLKNMINDLTPLLITDFALTNIRPLNQYWYKRGAVDIIGAPGTKYTGIHTMYFDKIDIALLNINTQQGYLGVSSTADFNVTIADVNEKLGTGLLRTEVTFSHVADAVYELRVANTNAMFFGSILIWDESVAPLTPANAYLTFSGDYLMTFSGDHYVSFDG